MAYEPGERQYLTTDNDQRDLPMFPTFTTWFSVLDTC